jgi:hypothetical protein
MEPKLSSERPYSTEHFNDQLRWSLFLLHILMINTLDRALQHTQHYAPSSTKDQMINKEWFLDRLREKKISQRGLAKKLGLDPAAITYMLKGERRMTQQEASNIAGILLVPVTEVMRQAGIDIHDDIRKIPVAGYITGQSTVTTLAPGAEDHIIAPSDVPTDSYAIQARTQMSPASFADSWLFIVSAARSAPHHNVGKLCLAASKTGQLYIGILSRGYKAAHYNMLLFLSNQTIENMDLLWSSPILWVKPL